MLASQSSQVVSYKIIKTISKLCLKQIRSITRETPNIDLQALHPITITPAHMFNDAHTYTPYSFIPKQQEKEIVIIIIIINRETSTDAEMGVMTYQDNLF